MLCTGLDDWIGRERAEEVIHCHSQRTYYGTTGANGVQVWGLQWTVFDSEMRMQHVGAALSQGESEAV